MLAWGSLLLAGVFEVGMTTFLKLEQRNRNWLWAFLPCAFISFTFLDRATREIPMGTAYAIWTSMGAVGTVLVGALAFGEKLRPATVGLLGVIVALIVALKVTA
ncbi:DMT family transporter [Enemella evansiae]|uniref:QacE family quaternary ammonium compound efflux SMR transporter n=1 Tax=Enemella evansiae TaxID=2016499 RepID=A0A255GBK7_9ACTN|nr:multidrug efflux SMR transporter [Enemella evansiae]PFG66004.1 quaternary ammonium compound-resistance protein SugE [Propionibacteriaceae bacterium ES.041]OYN99745.1 QacE family quaternary ammonium compound efflux SMR transporter [Enemella evansiae]OYO00155.1 QacE family quaternary ammonium compound efflux SMR transporter [Enemella evansiae]OYO04633.1 QacE family quaternary ammonium compound efflux SMR transporter [Enemella evansiae]OYO09132.1 QacE family quaternary ammonium compound efflux